MKEIRFIHTADLHLDTPFKGLSHLPEAILTKVNHSTFQAFLNVVNLAIEEKCNFIVVAGDLYDSANRSLRAQSFLKKQFERLKQYDIAVYIIHGNHDHLAGKWVSISWPENVFFFSGNVEYKIHETRDGVLVYLHGFSYEKREVYDNKLNDFQRVDSVDFNIGILHGQAEGILGHDPYAPFKINELLDKHFDYWALGHIHQYTMLESTIFYPGNIQGRHRNECGEKGCLLVHLKEGMIEPYQVKFHPTSKILWDEVEISIKNLEDIDALRDKLVDQIEMKRKQKEGTLLHINFVGNGELHAFLTEGELEELINLVNEEEDKEDSFVWIASYKQNTSGRVDIERLKGNDDFLGDIARLGDEFTNDDQLELLQELFGHRKGKHYLSELDEEEFLQVKKEAQYLILSKLIEEWQK